MSDEKIVAGDTVKLKSGGPLMTVSSTDYQDSQVLCQWFQKNDSKKELFPAVSLQKCSPDDYNAIGIL